MSGWTPDERKAYRRTEKACEAFQDQIDSTHFALWRLELAETPKDDHFDDDDPEDGPPPGWTATELN